MPNRIIKESICSSDSINELKWFEEVLFYRLIVNCDDYGRFDGRIPIIKNTLFPLRESVTSKNVEDGINKLASVGLVTLYKVHEKPFLFLPTWNDHQRLRNSREKYPRPEDACLPRVAASCGELPPESESEIESESERKSKEKEVASPSSTPARHKYGEYSNVLLSDADMEKLQTEFPADWRERIERLSSYMASSGKGYKNHLATIRNWARKDRERQEEQKSSKPAIEGDIEF